MLTGGERTVVAAEFEEDLAEAMLHNLGDVAPDIFAACEGYCLR